MRNYISIGSSPCDEPCAQVGQLEYYPKAMAECKRFIDVIRKKLGDEPSGAHLAVKSNPHDFGNYLEVICYFEDSNKETSEYALRCESDAPTTWDG